MAARRRGLPARRQFGLTSATSTTGNLGGLSGADATCQRLAVAAGHGTRLWRAYLSVERDATNNNLPTNARDQFARARVLRAPYARRKQRGGIACEDRRPSRLRRRTGQRINGQWPGSPGPNQHDILTGFQRRADGLDRVHVCGLDLRLDEHRRPSRPLRRPGARWEYELGCSRHGIRRTRARVAPIPYLVAEPASSTASRGSSGAGLAFADTRAPQRGARPERGGGVPAPLIKLANFT